MGTDDDIYRSAQNALVNPPLFLRRHGAGQQRRTKRQSVSLRHRRHGLIMLGGKHFGGRHQRPLITVGYAKQQGKEGKDCLAGPHIPLYQPVHHLFPLQIRPDFPPNLLLRPGQFIGKQPEQPPRLRIIRHGHPVFQYFVMFPAFTQHQKKQEKFVKRQSPARGQHMFPVRREMDVFHRFPVIRKPRFPLHPLRQIVRRKFIQRQRLPHRFRYRMVGQSCRQGISRLQNAGQLKVLLRPENLRLLHDQPAVFFVHYPTEDIKQSPL